MSKTRTSRYAPGFRRLLEYAAYDCAERGEREVRDDHLLLGLYREDFPLIDDVLAIFRVDSMVVLERLLKANPPVGRPVEMNQVELSHGAMDAIARGEGEADEAGDRQLTAAHVFLGVLQRRQDRIRDLFIREEFVERSQELVAEVRELVRWLRFGERDGQERQLEFLSDGSLVALDCQPLPGHARQPAGRTGLAVQLKWLTRFS